MSWSQSYVSYCRVLPPGELNDMNPEQRFTLRGAATWWIQCHVIPEPRVILRGYATWRIQCHDPRATCHIAGCCHLVNSITCHPRATCYIAGCCHLAISMSWSQSHIENRSSPYLFLVFLMQFELRRAAAFVSSHQLGQSHINNTRKNISQYNMY